MIENLHLDHIASTHITCERYEVADNKLNTLDLNTWIHQQDKKFYIGVVDIVGKNTDLGTMMATNINIVRPEEDICIVIRNYYLLKFKYDVYKRPRKRESIEHAVEQCIIDSAKNGQLCKILDAVLENYDVYLEQEDENEI
jgi:hypothetical protein